jgi:septal ring factor EnvC (AmiA/AmiB activator)
MSKCFRCEKRKAQSLHYLCKECYELDDGEPRNAGEEIIQLEKELSAARAKIASLTEQRDKLAKALERLEEQYIDGPIW